MIKHVISGGMLTRDNLRGISRSACNICPVFSERGKYSAQLSNVVRRVSMYVEY